MPTTHDYTDDELPTPTANLRPDPEVAALTRLYACLGTVERRRLGRLLQSWFHCNSNAQVLIEVLIEELANELAGD